MQPSEHRCLFYLTTGWRFQHDVQDNVSEVETIRKSKNEGLKVFHLSRITTFIGSAVMIFCLSSCPDTWNECFYGSSFYYPQFSPDGQKIVYVLPPEYFGCSDGGTRIYSIDLLDDNSNQLLHECVDHGWLTPQFSPDGAEILFKDANAVYLLNLEMNKVTHVADGPGYLLEHAVLSPDGQKILFISQAEFGSEWKLFIMNRNGTEQIEIADSISSDCKPQFSIDGSEVIFTKTTYDSSEHELIGDLYLMNTDGSNRRRLTNTPEIEIAPRFTPDGNKILFLAYPQNASKGQLIIMNNDGSDKLILNKDMSGVYAADIAPEGVGIVFSTMNGIFLTDTSGVDPTLLVFLFGNLPHFSPNGEQIVFASQGDEPGIWMMQRDGSNQVNLTEGLEL